MNRTGRLATLVLFLWLLAADRLPAPIVETAEKPKSAATSQAKAKRTKSKSSSRESSATQVKTGTVRPPPISPQSRFGGTWRGTMNWGMYGDVDVTLVIDPAGTTVNETNRYVSGTRALKNNGVSVTWHEGSFGSMSWTFTPNPDGKTALVRHTNLFIDSSATFRRDN